MAKTDFALVTPGSRCSTFQRVKASRSRRSSGVSDAALETKYLTSPVPGFCADDQPVRPARRLAVPYQVHLGRLGLPHLAR